MRPTNTSKQDPLINLFQPVEAQERQGQAQLVSGESLPTECPDRAVLEAAGVVFGQPYPDDGLFCPVTLPAGWTKRRTDHAMHSELVDDKGRVRAGIFYKAASYDRRADMRVQQRYSVSAYEDGSDAAHYACVIKDGGTVIHTVGETVKNDYNAREEIQQQADAWLDEHFPKWKSAAAYWD
jgi:hypothetical protein